MKEIITRRNYTKPQTLKQRFVQKFVINPESGCWEWQGALNNYGYGRFLVDYTNCLAHRVSYELYKEPLSSDRQVLHKCDNPKCVNPYHLFLGTPQDNADDKVRKGRHRNGTIAKRIGRILTPSKY